MAVTLLPSAEINRVRADECCSMKPHQILSSQTACQVEATAVPDYGRSHTRSKHHQFLGLADSIVCKAAGVLHPGLKTVAQAVNMV